MNETIPALSLREPWLYAILSLGKRIENRTWATKHRGRIRLHAAKTWDPLGEAFIQKLGLPCPREIDLRLTGRLGAYVGEVTVTDCKYRDGQGVPEWEEGQEDWCFGPWCWLLEDPEAYEKPVPGRGYPGLYLPERFAQ